MYDGTSVGGTDTFLTLSGHKSASSIAARSPWHEFLIESSEEERRLINFGLGSVIAQSVTQDRPVYLERFGVIFSSPLMSRTRSNISGRSYELISEKYKKIEFEKCTDLVSFQREKFSGVLELKDLVSLIKEKLSFFVQWKDRKIERYLRGFISLLKHEVVLYGYSERLSQLGTFYAVHNRQGNDENDWLSGADIFIANNHEEICETEILGKFIRPVLSSAREPLEAYYGKPISLLTINIAEEAKELGLSEKDFGSYPLPSDGSLHVAVYRDTEREDGPLTFVTDGLRHYGIGCATSGSELVFQFAPAAPFDIKEADLRGYCARPLVLAWMLLISNKDKAVTIGEGLSSSVSLLKNGKNLAFTSILITPFKLFPYEQLSTEGPFGFFNITLLYNDEAESVSKVGSAKLIALLERRALTQVNKESRGSLFGKTGRLMPNGLMVTPDPL